LSCADLQLDTRGQEEIPFATSLFERLLRLIASDGNMNPSQRVGHHDEKLLRCAPASVASFWGSEKINFERYDKRFEDALIALHRTALVGIVHGYAQHEEERDLREIDTVYLRGGGEFLIGLDGGRLVAMGGFKIFGGGVAEVKRVRILPEVQGRGIGSALLARLEAIARERRIRKLVLDSAASRPKTLQFWLKHGYVRMGETMYGTQPTVCFEKLLDEEPNPEPTCGTVTLRAGAGRANPCLANLTSGET
jgi:GNAT superfamily N-acetyltransferase